MKENTKLREMTKSSICIMIRDFSDALSILDKYHAPKGLYEKIDVISNHYWGLLSRKVNLGTTEFFKKFKKQLNWRLISQRNDLTDDFIREFMTEVNWVAISEYQTLSEDFIREFKNEVDWEEISENQILSEDFIREFKEDVYWEPIVMCQTLSEDFLREFKDVFDEDDWEEISRHQILSESFIREFKDDVSWNNIARSQKLSTDFIKEFKEELNSNMIYIYQSIEGLEPEFWSDMDFEDLFHDYIVEICAGVLNRRLVWELAHGDNTREVDWENMNMEKLSNLITVTKEKVINIVKETFKVK